MQKLKKSLSALHVLFMSISAMSVFMLVGIAVDVFNSTVLLPFQGKSSFNGYGADVSCPLLIPSLGCHLDSSILILIILVLRRYKPPSTPRSSSAYLKVLTSRTTLICLILRIQSVAMNTKRQEICRSTLPPYGNISVTCTN